MGADAYYALPAIFTEKPFIRPMGRNTQLPNTIRYIDMNRSAWPPSATSVVPIA